MLFELAAIVAVFIFREILSPLYWLCHPKHTDAITVYGARCPRCDHEVDWADQQQEWASRPVVEHAMRWHWATRHQLRLGVVHLASEAGRPAPSRPAPAGKTTPPPKTAQPSAGAASPPRPTVPAAGSGAGASGGWHLNHSTGKWYCDRHGANPCAHCGTAPTAPPSPTGRTSRANSAGEKKDVIVDQTNTMMRIASLGLSAVASGDQKQLEQFLDLVTNDLDDDPSTLFLVLSSVSNGVNVFLGELRDQDRDLAEVCVEIWRIWATGDGMHGFDKQLAVGVVEGFEAGLSPAAAERGVLGIAAHSGKGPTLLTLTCMYFSMQFLFRQLASEGVTWPRSTLSGVADVMYAA